MKKKKEIPATSLAEFKALLEKHDWHFAKSDDDKAYTRGLEAQLNLDALCVDNQEFRKLYRKRYREIFPAIKKQTDGKKE